MEPKEGLQAVERIESLLAAILERPERARDHAAELLVLIARLKKAMGGASRRQGARHGEGVQYRVEVVRGREALTEDRPNKRSNPARCPKPIYDGLAEVLQRAPAGLPFDELLDHLNDRTGEKQPDFLVRIALRFWQLRRPPLVEKVRGKYRAAGPKQMVRLARAAWEEARKS